MDVNGTRFHLVKGCQDWQVCRVVGDQDISRAAFSNCAERAQVHTFVAAEAPLTPVDWHERSASLTLRPLLVLFPRGKRDVPLTPEARRGADVDRFGNWYWISHDRQRLFWRPVGSQRSVVYWDQTTPACPQSSGDFVPTQPPDVAPAELAGLAVTEEHYLVVGDRTHGDLILFDLHAGGPPMRIHFPASASLDPFDIAAAPGGGLWVLDRRHRTYWGLDRTFRIVTEPSLLGTAPLEADEFRPVEGEAVVWTPPVFPDGFPLAETQNPISIVGLPDGSVLILDAPEGASFSTLYHYDLRDLQTVLPLQATVEIVQQDGTHQSGTFEMVGHDMAYLHPQGILYVVERDGNQAVTWEVDLRASPPYLTVRSDYLPMHVSGGRALVAHEAALFYDVGSADVTEDAVVRWVKLHAIERPHYARSASLLVGQREAGGTLDPGPVFDGKARDCVWHRLLLDACIPDEATVQVWSRAHDDRSLLASVPFSREPDLYLRGAGAEIPSYNPYSEKETVPPRTGTWELLFQRARGRYLQLRIDLQGNGRVTPQLRALRVYYPRFSYPEHYLPAAYVETGEPGPFLERMLANMEGFYTEVEGQIRASSLFFDPRTAPPETLDWLASWLGLLLDPLWGRIQQLREETPPGMSRGADRRRLVIRFARHLYERRGTPDGILFALHLLLEPCLEQMMAALQAAAVDPSHWMRAELARYALPLPTATTSDAEFEDLLYAFLLKRPSNVRIVERFLIHRGRGLVSGDPTTPVEPGVNGYAHRFNVLVPVGLAPEEEAMVKRVVALEKPAHTEFALRRYWDGFRIAEARLGIDTTLDRTNRFVAMMLARDYLADGYLPAAHPQNVLERVVADRDRLGRLPPL